MKSRIALVRPALLAAFIFGGLALASAQPPGRPNAAQHGWLSNYRQGLEQARETGKPLMLVFRCVP
jgi:hypothetical protein